MPPTGRRRTTARCGDAGRARGRRWAEGWSSSPAGDGRHEPAPSLLDCGITCARNRTVASRPQEVGGAASRPSNEMVSSLSPVAPANWSLPCTFAPGSYPFCPGATRPTRTRSTSVPWPTGDHHAPPPRPPPLRPPRPRPRPPRRLADRDGSIPQTGTNSTNRVRSGVAAGRDRCSRTPSAARCAPSTTPDRRP